MPKLTSLFLSDTNFGDLSTIVEAADLEILVASLTPLASIASIGGIAKLKHVSLQRTQVEDLLPLLELPLFASEQGEALTIRETPAADPARDRRLHMLSLLDPKRCAIETIQYLKGTHPDFRDPPKSNGATPLLLSPDALIKDGDIGLRVVSGALVATNAGRPEKSAPQQLAQRLQALRVHVAMLTEMARQRQVPPDILALFQTYAAALDVGEPTYVMLDGPMAFLRGGVKDSYVTEALDGMIVEGWRQLVMFHDELRPFLLPADEDDLPDLAEDATPDAALGLTDETIAALDDPSVDDSVRDALTAVKDYFEAAKQDAVRGPGLLRRGIKTLGGTVGQIVIGGAGGALGGWALTPQAAVIIERLRPIWEALLRFFVGG